MRILYVFLVGAMFATCGALVGCQTTTPEEWEQLGVTAEDGKIANQVRQYLRGEPSLARFPIQVNVRQGVVTLSGSVNNVSDAMRAYALTSAVPGVLKVDNKLTYP